MVQHVEGLGHWNCLSGHWTGIQELGIWNRMTQDSAQSVTIIPPSLKELLAPAPSSPATGGFRGWH